MFKGFQDKGFSGIKACFFRAKRTFWVKKTRSKVKVKAVMEACYGWQYFYEGTLFYCSIFFIDNILPKIYPQLYITL